MDNTLLTKPPPVQTMWCFPQLIFRLQLVDYTEQHFIYCFFLCHICCFLRGCCTISEWANGCLWIICVFFLWVCVCLFSGFTCCDIFFHLLTILPVPCYVNQKILIHPEDVGLTSAHDSKRIKDFAERIILQVYTKALSAPPCLCPLMRTLNNTNKHDQHCAVQTCAVLPVCLSLHNQKYSLLSNVKGFFILLMYLK